MAACQEDETGGNVGDVVAEVLGIVTSRRLDEGKDGRFDRGGENGPGVCDAHQIGINYVDLRAKCAGFCATPIRNVRFSREFCTLFESYRGSFFRFRNSDRQPG